MSKYICVCLGLECSHPPIFSVYEMKDKAVPEEENRRIPVLTHPEAIRKLPPETDLLLDLGIIVQECPGRGDIFRRHISFLVPFK